MTCLDDLIVSSERLCKSLDDASQNDKKFCDDLLMAFEKMSWEMLRISNDLKQIKEFQGGYK